jgi:hypothetical protein
MHTVTKKVVGVFVRFSCAAIAKYLLGHEREMIVRRG